MDPNLKSNNKKKILGSLKMNCQRLIDALLLI